LEDVKRIGIYAADVGRSRKKRKEGGSQRWGVIGTYNRWWVGAPGEERRWTMNGYITGSADVETCVIMKIRFRMLDPLLVYSPFNRSTLHVK
jgi:hypothetical protein